VLPARVALRLPPWVLRSLPRRIFVDRQIARTHPLTPLAAQPWVVLPSTIRLAVCSRCGFAGMTMSHEHVATTPPQAPAVRRTRTWVCTHRLSRVVYCACALCGSPPPLPHPSPFVNARAWCFCCCHSLTITPPLPSSLPALPAPHCRAPRASWINQARWRG
jgi:hypothetical protein